MAEQRKTERRVYVCSDCGAESPKWVGQCPDCQSWNTLQESLRQTTAGRNPRFDGYAGEANRNRVYTLADVGGEATVGIPTNLTGCWEADWCLVP